MEQLEVKLVHSNPYQRFYKLNKKVKIFATEFDYDKEFKYEKERLKPEYVGCMDHLEDGTDIICISDAHTHIERLVFPGIDFIIDGKQDYGRFSLQCDGKHTFMIFGGNSDSVYPDEVYLRRLASANKLELKLIS